jgi:hypothetical protein
MYRLIVVRASLSSSVCQLCLPYDRTI